MMQSTIRLLGVLGLALVGAGPTLAQGKPWLHVQVQEAKGSTVNVNLPLSLLEIAIQAAPERLFDGDHIRIGGHDGKRLRISDAKRMWQELKDAGDTDFVTLQNPGQDETVRLSRKGELVQVRLDGSRKGDRVSIDVPVALVDALFAAEGEELDLRGAIRELSKRRGDVVRVEDENDHVRIWIDEGR